MRIGLADRNVQRVDLALSAGVLKLPHPLFAGGVNVDCVFGNALDPEEEPRSPHEHEHEDEEGRDDPSCLKRFRRLVVLSQLVLGRAAVLDGQIENHEERDHRDAAADDAHERHQRVDAWRDGRGLLGPQRKIRKHHRECSLRIMMKMKPARLRIVATPPARTKFMAERLYLPVAGS